MAGPEPKKVMAFTLIFFICFLAYGPMVTEISALADNATTTNSIILFLDSWFGLFWIIWCVFLLSIDLAAIIGYI